MLGPACTPPDSLDGIAVSQFRDGEPAGSVVTGEQILDDPYLSLARVVPQLTRHRFAIEPRQQIITGSILPGMSTNGFDHFSADFAGLGSVAVDPSNRRVREFCSGGADVRLIESPNVPSELTAEQVGTD